LGIRKRVGPDIEGQAMSTTSSFYTAIFAMP
jgi:hypothetical protein